jgi:soluble lytic murein transglycosylase-like protein
MRIRFALSGLLGASILFASSASTPIDANPSVIALGQPAPIESGEASEIPNPKLVNLPLRGAMDAPFAEAPPLGDVAPADDAPAEDFNNVKPPTTLERAKAALAESDAPVLSKHEICTSLVAVARANELPVGFFANLIWRESQFDHVAISRVGAMGIAQFMPDVADKLGVDAFDARDALPASGRLLRELRARFGNLGLVAAAYNAGPKRVSDWLRQRSGLPSETREYVSLITGRPVEQWRNASAKAVVFTVPRQVPCHRTPEFSVIEQAERAAQLQKVAEEQRLLRKIAEEQKLQKKAREALERRARKKKGHPTMTASRGRVS